VSTPNTSSEDAETQSRDAGSAADRIDPNRTRDPLPTPKPSQAEGDRETIEEDLRDKEASGDL